jgi:hypothetical protein
VISLFHTSIFNQLGSIRTHEQERAIWVDMILLCIVAAGRPFFLLFFLDFYMLLHIHVLMLRIAPDGIVVKGKKQRQTRTMLSKKRESERANDVSWTFAHTYVLQKKSICFSIHSSFFLSHVCFFFLALFFRLSLVLLSSSSSSSLSSLFDDIRTAMFFVCSMPFTLPCVRMMGEARERERR